MKTKLIRQFLILMVAVFCITSLLTGNAQAATINPSITLFQDVDYGGKSLPLTTSRRNLEDSNFNDTTSSLKVEKGTWIAYEDADFKGKAYVLKEGNYSIFSDWQGTNDTISSIQRLPMNAVSCLPSLNAGNAQAATINPSITLFQDVDYGGKSLPLTTSRRNLEDSNFNDTTSSLKVEKGTWIAYEDADFKGKAYVLKEGSYSTFSDWQGTNDTISSVQSLPMGEALILFEDEELSGSSVPICESQLDFNNINFNDKASSAIVMGGRWKLCDDIDFSGNCWELDSEKAVYRKAPNWGGNNDYASSVQKLPNQIEQQLCSNNIDISNRTRNPRGVSNCTIGVYYLPAQVYNQTLTPVGYNAPSLQRSHQSLLERDYVFVGFHGSSRAAIHDMVTTGILEQPQLGLSAAWRGFYISPTPNVAYGYAIDESNPTRPSNGAMARIYVPRQRLENMFQVNIPLDRPDAQSLIQANSHIQLGSGVYGLTGPENNQGNLETILSWDLAREAIAIPSLIQSNTLNDGGNFNESNYPPEERQISQVPTYAQIHIRDELK